MAIKIPDNLMNRPNSPGGMSDESAGVTRAFGNRTEQAASYQEVQRGWGGVANESAGAENRAYAQAAQQVTASIQDTVQYMDNIKLADQDSMFRADRLGIEFDANELREELDADPEFAKKSIDQQEMEYKLRRDAKIEERIQKSNYTHPRIRKMVKDQLEEFRVTDSIDYSKNVLTPRMVEQRKTRDTTIVGNVIGIAQASLDPTTTRKAADEIKATLTTPQAWATYGHANAEAFALQSMAALKKGVVVAFEKRADDVLDASWEKFGFTGQVTKEAVTEGPIAMKIADELLKQELNLVEAGANESERFVARENLQKYLQRAAINKISAHNQAWKVAEKERQELDVSEVQTMGFAMKDMALDGKLTDSVINKNENTAMRALGIDPVAAREGNLTDPYQIKMYGEIRNQSSSARAEQKRTEAERRRLDSEKKTRDTIAQLRMDNGIAVSSGQADTAWRKSGALQSFFDNGNRLTPQHLAGIESAGAVPTSILGSIHQDVRSSDPAVQARGIANLRLMKSHSSKTQGALYRDMPDDFAGVIHRIDSGWTTKEALAFMTRPRNPPDVETKLKTEAKNKDNLAIADRAMKGSNLDPKNMSATTRENLRTQWQDAYSRASGDSKLATELFKQDLAKNRTIGKSAFTGVVEQYPITNFAPKQTITSMINRDFPQTVGKEIIPVFSGLKSDGVKEQPTYDIYIREGGNLERVTSENQQFYTTQEEVAAFVDGEKSKVIEEEVQKAEKRKAKTQAAIDRNEAVGGVAALRARKNMLDAAGKE